MSLIDAIDDVARMRAEKMRRKLLPQLEKDLRDARNFIEGVINLAEHGDADLDQRWNELLNEGRRLLGRSKVEFVP